MKFSDVADAVDIQGILDRLECCCDTQDYYKINHLSEAEINDLQSFLIESLVDKLGTMGLEVKL